MPVPASPWNRLFSDIKIQIPGAIDAAIRQELWRAVEDFLDQTNVWIEEIPFAVMPNVLSYTVTPTSNSCIGRLMMVFDPANASPDRRWTQQGIRFKRPDTIVLMHSPSTMTTWMAAVTKNILDPPSAEGYPILDPDYEWIIDQYRDALSYCTLSYLYFQPAKPYSNLQLSKINWQNYVVQRGKARGEILHENVYGGQKWMYPQGWATTTRKGWI